MFFLKTSFGKRVFNRKIGAKHIAKRGWRFFACLKNPNRIEISRSKTTIRNFRARSPTCRRQNRRRKVRRNAWRKDCFRAHFFAKSNRRAFRAFGVNGKRLKQSNRVRWQGIVRRACRMTRSTRDAKSVCDYFNLFCCCILGNRRRNHYVNDSLQKETDSLTGEPFCGS